MSKTLKRPLDSVPNPNLSPEKFQDLMLDLDKLQYYSDPFEDSERDDVGAYYIDMNKLNRLYAKYGIQYEADADNMHVADGGFVYYDCDKALQDIEKITGYNTFAYSKTQALYSMIDGADTSVKQKGNAKFETMKNLQAAEREWHGSTGVEFNITDISNYAYEKDGYKQIAKDTSRTMQAAELSGDLMGKFAFVCEHLNRYYDSQILDLAVLYFKEQQQKVDPMKHQILDNFNTAKLVDPRIQPEVSTGSKYESTRQAYREYYSNPENAAKMNRNFAAEAPNNNTYTQAAQTKQVNGQEFKRVESFDNVFVAPNFDSQSQSPDAKIIQDVMRQSEEIDEREARRYATCELGS